MTTAANRDFVSIGALAAQLQRSVRVIEQAATAVALQPAMRINGIPHFDGEQCEMLTAYFRSQTMSANQLQQQADSIQ